MIYYEDKGNTVIYKDFTLSVLLDLDGIVYWYPSGYWLKIEAKQMRRSSNYPYGIKYSLTLHNPSNERVIGYDNAHALPGASRDSAFDHKHKGERTIAYQYSSAAQLLSEFYKDIDLTLERAKNYEYEN
jgi:hypothetical protein